VRGNAGDSSGFLFSDDATYLTLIAPPVFAHSIAMACDIKQWRDSVLMEEETAPDRPYTPILRLFTTASSLYGLLLECVEGLLPTPDIRRLERERDRLRLWADGYGVVSGNLDRVLADTRRMRHSTICLLVSICRTLVKGLSQCSCQVLGRNGTRRGSY